MNQTNPKQTGGNAHEESKAAKVAHIIELLEMLARMPEKEIERRAAELKKRGITLE